MLKYPGYFIIAVLIFTGCSNLTDSSDVPKSFLQTKQSEYTPTINEETDVISFNIGTTFTNFRDDSVFITNCKGGFSFELQKRVDGEWETALSPINLMCLSPPIKIAAGSTFNRILQFSGGLSRSELLPKFQVEDIEGTYRLVWMDVLSSFDANAQPFGEQIPFEQRVSNTFKIMLPEN